MFKHYLLTALRSFRRHWLTTTVNVVGLTLGLMCFIGALSAVKYYQLDDQHYPGADRTYFLTSKYTLTSAGSAFEGLGVPWVLAEHLKATFPRLDAVARLSNEELDSFTVAGEPYDLQTSYADAEFLKIFPIPFLFGDSSSALAQPRSAVISEKAALRIFGRHDVIGRQMLLDGQEPVTITGVMSAPPQPSHIGSLDSSKSSVQKRFEMLISMDLLRTVMARTSTSEGIEKSLHSWTNGALVLTTYICLPKDNSINVDTVSRWLALMNEEHKNSARQFNMHPISQMRALSLEYWIEGTGLSWSAFLFIIAGIVLIASCLNYANLAAAVLVSHRKDLGVRRAIGASTAELAKQLLIETATVIVIALATALAFLAILNHPLNIAFNVDMIFAWRHSANLWPTLLAVVAAICLLLSVYPLLMVSRLNIPSALQQSRRHGGKSLTMRWLVITQFFLANMLLIAMFGMRLQNQAMRQEALNSLPDPIVAVENNLDTAGVNVEVLRDELSEQPGIASISTAQFSPWNQSYGLITVSSSLEASARDIEVVSLTVGANYFKTLGISSLAGDTSDPVAPSGGTDDTKVLRVVLERSAARQLGWSNPQDAIGKAFYPGSKLLEARKLNTILRVKGVVEDKPQQFSGKGASAAIYFYNPKAAKSVIVRLNKSRLTEGMSSINAVWSKLAPNQVLRGKFLDERIDEYMATRNANVRLIAWVTVLALAIAISGLIGMSIHMANRRRHEIGVRKTFGARTVQVTTLLLRDFSKPVIIGNMLSWPLAYIAIQAYQNQYIHRVGFSPLPFLLGLTITLLIAGTAVTWQSVHAARLNPAKVLRHE